MKQRVRKINAIPTAPEREEVGEAVENNLPDPDPQYYDPNAIAAAKNGLTAWRLTTLGLLAGNLLMMLGFMGALGTANSRSFPTIIARSTGERETLEFQLDDKRSDQTIELFAKSFVTDLYTWRSYTAEPGSPLDPGMEVGGGKIPTSVYRASLALEEPFGEAYRKQLAQLKEIASAGSSKIETAYIPQQIGKPESLGAGKWKIAVTGTQLIANTKGAAAIANPVNLELTLQAVPPPLLSETEKQYSDPGIAKQVRDSLVLGLQVTNITDLNHKNTTKK